MSVQKEVYEEAVMSSRMPGRSRRENNQLTIRHLLEEAFDGEPLPRAFWGEAEKGRIDDPSGWEAQWIPI